jgi:hypothetical protein
VEQEDKSPRPRRKRKVNHVPEAKRTSKEVEHPPTEKPVLVVETPEPNKYAPKKKVGTPTLGRSPNYVTKVGLGKLTTVTAHGNTDV